MNLSIRYIAIGLAVLALLYIFFISRSELFKSRNATVPCQEPLEYHIGEIDSRFDIQKGDLKDLLAKVETIWESPVNKNLLQYSATRGVKINLVYGSEQQVTESRQTLENKIQRNEERISSLDKELSSLVEQYEKQKKNLKEFYKNYQSLLAEYNQTVDKWNRRGNVPDRIKENINQMKIRLQNMKSDLRRREENINMLRNKVESRNEQMKRLVEIRKKLTGRYKRKFTEQHTFNQGKYINDGGRKRINIYQFSNRAELKTVLAHETGHALGIGHVDNPESIMHKMMGRQDIQNLNPSSEDLAALQKICEN